MRKNSLVSNKGLSLSQAQSISNLCNQRALEIERKLAVINNSSKTVKVNGEDYVLEQANPMPANVVDLLKEKATLHACQAFLMENLKAKDAMLKETKLRKYEIPEGLASLMPPKPEFQRPSIHPEVTEEYGWEQLTPAELAEYYEVEAFASHIGQFIHGNKSVLGKLRDELPTLSQIEWMTVKTGEQTPVKVTIHHKSEDLLKTHEELAGLHREFEMRTNSFKARVKNMTTEKNAEIAKANADEQNRVEKINNDLQLEYETAVKKVGEKINSAKAEFEKERQARIKEIAAMRIEVAPRFQKTIDMFMPKAENK